MKKGLEILIQTIKIYNQKIAKEFDGEKCALLMMKSGKIESTEGIGLKSIRTLRQEENCGNLGSRHHQISEKEGEKIGKEYLRRIRKLLKTNLCSRNHVKEINICRILSTILKMDKGKVDDYAQVFTSERWHRLDVLRIEGGRGLASTGDCIDASILGLEEQRKIN